MRIEIEIEVFGADAERADEAIDQALLDEDVQDAIEAKAKLMGLRFAVTSATIVGLKP